MDQDQHITHYEGPAFQEAFRTYFAELGCHVTDWEGLFGEMTESGDETWLRMDEAGSVIGFIQFAAMEMKNWFFTAKCGFIMEFWIAPAFRRKGHGSALLALAENSLREAGCGEALLTTDAASDFYLHRGYARRPEITAANQAEVFGKRLG